MKLIRFGTKGNENPGVIDCENIWRDISSFVSDWTGETVGAAETLLAGIDVSGLPVIDPSTRLGPPIGNVGKIIGCALTYGKHAQEAGLETPSEPMFMLTSRTAINGPYDDVIIPRGATELDWEAELVVVLGKGGSYISAEDAMDHVAGYCVGNDVSERQFQLERGTQWTKGKSADTLKPIGPWLVTKEDVPNPNDLDISIKINGERRQSSNTGDMVFTIAELVSNISQYVRWEAGDIMFTGTPPGVGYGMKPQLYMKPGDIMEPTIAGLGSQKSKIIPYA
ncbi:fumarylacetoacetate hydrolase family protein [Hellea balneolensis]|uniref:fumarylacetoacetate hydrolase family protein n=1 Tax=Hellea balneolensis TaxID=287478 RepID=UPI00040E0655|nr:fumarylacetoacetate hydrolase family protein [Hellea balneolensis]